MRIKALMLVVGLILFLVSSMKKKSEDMDYSEQEQESDRY